MADNAERKAAPARPDATVAEIAGDAWQVAIANGMDVDLLPPQAMEVTVAILLRWVPPDVLSALRRQNAMHYRASPHVPDIQNRTQQFNAIMRRRFPASEPVIEHAAADIGASVSTTNLNVEDSTVANGSAANSGRPNPDASADAGVETGQSSGKGKGKQKVPPSAAEKEAMQVEAWITVVGWIFSILDYGQEDLTAILRRIYTTGFMATFLQARNTTNLVPESATEESEKGMLTYFKLLTGPQQFDMGLNGCAYHVGLALFARQRYLEKKRLPLQRTEEVTGKKQAPIPDTATDKLLQLNTELLTTVNRTLMLLYVMTPNDFFGVNVMAYMGFNYGRIKSMREEETDVFMRIFTTEGRLSELLPPTLRKEAVWIDRTIPLLESIVLHLIPFLTFLHHNALQLIPEKMLPTITSTFALGENNTSVLKTRRRAQASDNPDEDEEDNCAPLCWPIVQLMDQNWRHNFNVLGPIDELPEGIRMRNSKIVLSERWDANRMSNARKGRVVSQSIAALARLTAHTSSSEQEGVPSARSTAVDRLCAQRKRRKGQTVVHINTHKFGAPAEWIESGFSVQEWEAMRTEHQMLFFVARSGFREKGLEEITKVMAKECYSAISASMCERVANIERAKELKQEFRVGVSSLEVRSGGGGWTSLPSLAPEYAARLTRQAIPETAEEEKHRQQVLKLLADRKVAREEAEVAKRSKPRKNAKKRKTVVSEDTIDAVELSGGEVKAEDVDVMSDV